jgi:hypothetical protein
MPAQDSVGAKNNGINNSCANIYICTEISRQFKISASLIKSRLIVWNGMPKREGWNIFKVTESLLP